MIPHSFLQDLLARVDIVDVVGRYVQLKKGGANFVGLCPFHNEKGPSFTVSPTKQFYHCFGCGANGTAIGFLMEHAGLTFPEAVEELAQSVGMAVPHEQQSRGGGAGGAGAAAMRAASGLSDVLQTAADYYRRQLRASRRAVDYLKGRGVTGEIALHFGLGYAPDGWQNLEAALGDYRGAAPVDAGLVIVSDKTDAQGQPRRYDRFRDRVMFPIRNVRGQVIGFGGRVLDGGEPKYLNSPETPLFSKGSELYGLFEARAAIREKGYVLVVEGYMDVVALAQLGFPNAVATLGTACTPMHIQKLMRQTDAVVFSFDGDAAGRRAARRALDACLPHAADNRTIRFLFLPPEHDPDSFIRAHGADGFAAAIERAIPLSQFLLQEIVAGRALDQPEGRAAALFDAKPLLQALPPNALRAQILHLLAERLDTPFAEVASLCAIDAAGPARARARARAAPAYAERRRVTGTEERALRNLVMYPRTVAVLDGDDVAVLTSLTRAKALFVEVIEHARQLGEAADYGLLKDYLSSSPNADAYEPIFQGIVSYDENVRDLLPHQPERIADVERRREQERAAGDELRSAAVRLRYDALSERCEQLSRQVPLSPAETAEFSELVRQTADLKKRLGSLGGG